MTVNTRYLVSIAMTRPVYHAPWPVRDKVRVRLRVRARDKVRARVRVKADVYHAPWPG